MRKRWEILASNILYLRIRLVEVIKNFKEVFVVLMLSNFGALKKGKLNEKFVSELKAANIISSRGVKIYSDLSGLWNQADYLFGRGNYWQSLALRKRIFSRIYEIQGIEDSNYYPQLISSSYTVAIGHLGALHLNNLAEDLGLLPSGPRKVIIENRVGNAAALKFVASKVVPMKTFNPSGILALSSTIENYQLVRTVDGFADRYELWQRVFEKSPGGRFASQRRVNRITIENFEKAKKSLETNGVDPKGKIALIHLRDNGNEQEVRNVRAQDYLKAIELLHIKGFQVCQIGSDEKNNLSKMLPYVHNIAGQKSLDGLVDFYLQTNADIFVGTTSGPTVFPLLFGIPSLITNLTSVSRNTFASSSSLYIPKLLTNRIGKPLEIESMFTNRFSFGGEFLKKQLQRANLVLKDNTPDEIVEGLEELLSRMNDDGFIKLSRVDEIILEIRSAARVASFGHISNSFLWRNYKIG